MRFRSESERQAHPQARLIPIELWKNPSLFNEALSDEIIELMQLSPADWSTKLETMELEKFSLKEKKCLWLALYFANPPIDEFTFSNMIQGLDLSFDERFLLSVESATRPSFIRTDAKESLAETVTTAQPETTQVTTSPSFMKAEAKESLAETVATRRLEIAKAATNRIISNEEIKSRRDCVTQEETERAMIIAIARRQVAAFVTAQAATSWMTTAEKAQKKISLDTRDDKCIEIFEEMDAQATTKQEDATKFARCQEAVEIIKKSSFQKFIKEEAALFKKIDQLSAKSRTNSKYKDAATASKNLQEELIKIRKSFVEGESNLQEFKTSYKQAIDNSKPILKQSEGGNKIIRALLDVANALCLVLTFGTLYRMNNKFRIFSMPTVSENELDTLKQKTNNI